MNDHLGISLLCATPASTILQYACWQSALLLLILHSWRLLSTRATIGATLYGLFAATCAGFAFTYLPPIPASAPVLATIAAACISGAFASRLGLRLRPIGHAMLVVGGYCLSGALLCVFAGFGPTSTPQDLLVGLIVATALAATGIHSFFAVAVENPALNLWPARLEAALARAASTPTESPFVSILVPCYSEPPDMVIRTLSALNGLDYDNFEVVVVDNNTADETLWRPVERHCTLLGPRFRFFHVSPLAGAKAGALNFAHKHLDPRATIIGLVDADYVAEPSFLRKFTPFLSEPSTAFVQTSHDYFDWEDNPFLRGCYFEYVRFHKLSMVGLNELDAGFPVGTMALVSREALDRVGGWAEWCLTEDSEVAIRLTQHGYAGIIVGDTAGRGLLPANFADVKKQIFRWSAGPIEQLVAYIGEYIRRLFSNVGHDRVKTLFSLRNHLHYVPGALLPLWTLALLVFASADVVRGSSTAMPWALLIFWGACRLSKLAERWISLNEMGSRRFSDLIRSLAVENALKFTKLQATITALSGRRMKWRRTPKFAHHGRLSRGFQAASQELILGLVFVIAALTLLYFARPEGVTLAVYAALRSAWLGVSYCMTLWISLSAELAESSEDRRRRDAINLGGALSERSAADGRA